MMGECRCSWSISALGDGCRYCQPQEYIDQLVSALEDEIAITDHAEELAKALEPFANYACDDEADPNHCQNCTARYVLNNYREATK